MVKKKPIRLCVLIPTHWAAVMGGSQYQAKVLIEELLDHGGYEIYYLTARVDPDFSPQGYQIVEISQRTGLRRYGAFADTRRLLRLLTEIRPDVIYQRVGCAYTGVSAYYARKHRCRMIWHVAHDRTLMPFDSRFSRDWLFRYIERRMLEYGIHNAGQIVAQTRWQQELLQERFERSSIVIPNFHPEPRNTPEKGAPIKVVWVANMKQWKRPELFVQLAADLQVLPEVEFIMVGEPPAVWGDSQGGKLDEKIAAVPSLKYLGPLSQDEVNSLLGAAHVFVNTSRYEGFANTFIQAWMRRVPVVSLEVDPDGIISREEVGLFAAGSYEKMRDQVRSLVQDQGLRERMADRARDYAFANHGKANIQRLIELFEA